jgi:hypothetical protein
MLHPAGGLAEHAQLLAGAHSTVAEQMMTALL